MRKGAVSRGMTAARAPGKGLRRGTARDSTTASPIFWLNKNPRIAVAGDGVDGQYGHSSLPDVWRRRSGRDMYLSG
jgi:hypothetical protein